MLVTPIQKGENIDKALKRFKRKFTKTGTKAALNSRKEFNKPSLKRRTQVQKARYIQSLKDQEAI